MDQHHHHRRQMHEQEYDHRRNMSKIQTISVISFLSFSVIVGALVFSRGFLLNRQIISDKAGPCLDAAYQERDQFYHEQRDHHQELGVGVGQKELLSNLSEAASWCNPSPVFKKAILILVDALRYDFVSRMTFLSSTVINKDKDKLKDNYKEETLHKGQSSTTSTTTTSTNNLNNNDNHAASRSRSGHDASVWESASCLFRFVADPPTTTMQRLKALMTGTMPTFIDASANFNSYEVEEDSLIYQLHAMGKKLAFLGDDTWLSLFPPSYFKSPIVEAHPSFNAWDLDTVDRAVNHSLRNKIFGREAEKEWDVLIAHLLGVDHCGHRYGPSHPEMVRKLREADEIIEFVFNSMSQDTLLVVFGDHGMTPTGDHGGDSKDETDAAVVFLSKAIKQRRNIRGGEMNSGGLNSANFQCPSYSSAISQIDLVPTLATLLGTPIPYSSIGQLIPNFIGKKGLYSDAVASNTAQVERYLRKFGIVGGAPKPNSDGHGLEDEYLRLQEAFHAYQLSRTNQSSRAKLNALAHKYLNQVKLIAVSTWTQFNVPMIYCGVVISSLACFSLFVYLNNVRSLLSPRRKHKYSVLSWLWPSLPLWSVCVTFFQDRPSPATSLWNVIVSTCSGLVMFLLALGLKLIQRMGEEEEDISFTDTATLSTKRKNVWSFSDLGSLTIYMLTCLAMFSNSFVINEGYMLGSCLMLVVFLHILTSPYNMPRRSNNTRGEDQTRSSDHHPGGVVGGKDEFLLIEILCRKSTKCSLVCFVTLAVLVRICSIFFRCREELTECTEDYLLHKQLSSLPEDWLVHKYVRYSIALVSLAIFVVAFRLWMLYRKFLFSKRPAAIVAKFIPSLLVVLLGVLWALQGLPFISTSAAKLRPILNYFPWVFQASTFISLVIVWVKPIVSGGGAGQTLLLPSHFQVGCSKCSQASTGKKRVELINTGSTAAANNNAVMWSKSSSITGSNNSSTVYKPNLHKSSSANGVNKKVNGLQKLCDQISLKNQPKRDMPYGNQRRAEQLSKSVFLEIEQQKYSFEDSVGTGSYSCSILVFATLVIVLMAQITSAGLTPAVAIVIPYSIICLVGIYRGRNLSVSSTASQVNSEGDSWGGVVAWTLCSQYLFYGTGHQPIFSAIPWDSAFLTTTDGTSFTDASGSWLTWLRPALAILGNLHVSQITFSLALPLLAYWSNETPLFCHHQCHAKRRKAYILCGKYIFLHGVKLLACMACAGWHRRHLMVWKIFAPKFIFETVSFIVTLFTVLFSLVFVTRIDFLYHRNRHKTHANN
ncbi:unnamed protein product [Orchesella dallaii]|uniref:GPI ethanolamine phosphate transferase 3 n=1 Tax=Orchesella dallaii TaxID=48710 RepID=A0ABP1PLH1_9HEXA